jgi:excisionase family DNA binding protein
LPGTVKKRPLPLNTGEVAAELRLHIKTVRAMLERGEIPAVKLAGRWFIQRETLDRLLAGEQR